MNDEQTTYFQTVLIWTDVLYCTCSILCCGNLLNGNGSWSGTYLPCSVGSVSLIKVKTLEICFKVALYTKGNRPCFCVYVQFYIFYVVFGYLAPRLLLLINLGLNPLGLHLHVLVLEVGLQPFRN